MQSEVSPDFASGETVSSELPERKVRHPADTWASRDSRDTTNTYLLEEELEGREIGPGVTAVTPGVADFLASNAATGASSQRQPCLGTSQATPPRAPIGPLIHTTKRTRTTGATP